MKKVICNLSYRYMVDFLYILGAVSGSLSDSFYLFYIRWSYFAQFLAFSVTVTINDHINDDNNKI